MAFYTTSATDSLWKRERSQIDASAVVNTKQIPVANFKSIKYIFSFAGGNKTYYLEMVVINENGNLKSSVWGKTGTMKVSILEKLVSGVFSIEIINNETFGINLDAVSLTLGQ